MNAAQFLIDTLFNLYLMVVLLRLWLQLAKADFYNPFSQFIVKATHPIVGPLRRVIPSVGRFDTATLLLAFAVAALKIITLSAVLGAGFSPSVVVIGAVFTIVKEIFSLLFWVLIIQALLSWVSQGYNPMQMVLQQLTEPLLEPVRRVIPPMGGLDLSVLVVLIGLQFLQLLVKDLFF